MREACPEEASAWVGEREEERPLLLGRTDEDSDWTVFLPVRNFFLRWCRPDFKVTLGLGHGAGGSDGKAGGGESSKEG